MSSETEALLFETSALLASVLTVLLVLIIVVVQEQRPSLSDQDSIPGTSKTEERNPTQYGPRAPEKTLTRLSNLLRNQNVTTKNIIEVSPAGPDRQGRPQFRVDLRDITFERARNLLRAFDKNKRYGVRGFGIEREIAGHDTFRVVYRVTAFTGEV